MANRKFDIQLKDKSRNLLYPLAHKDSSGNIIPTTYVKKSGDKMSGDLGLIGVSSLENYSGSSQKENYSRREVYAEISVSEVQAIDSTLTTNSSISDYMAGILKALCVKYPNRVNTIFKGHTAKGSHFYYEVFIYNTNNKVNDLPQYSFGSLRNYNTRGNVTTFYLIGTGISSNNHSYYCVNVTAHSVQNKIYYGTCSTAADTAEKAVDCNNFVLATGATVLVTFSNTNSVAVASLTLNVDGTGAAPIKCFRNGGINNLPGVGYLASNQTYLFSYDGTNWVTLIDYNTNSSVAQTATSDNNDYEILFSGSADNTTKTEGARKNSNLLFNPSTGKLQVGGSIGSGTLSDTAERFVGVYSNSGSILLDSVGNSNGDGTRGIWIGAHGIATKGKWALQVDTDNNVVVNGSSSLNLLKAGDTMSGDLAFAANKGINFVSAGRLYWKENNYGDQFAIVPYFSGSDDDNLLKIQSAVGAQGTTPDLSDKITITGKSGNVNIISGTLTLLKTQDASGAADNKPALIIGGASTAQHIEMDGNEILSKENGNTPGILWLQDSSGTVKVGGTGGLIIDATNSDTGFRCRNISYGTAAPSGGNSGDLYIQYTEPTS